MSISKINFENAREQWYVFVDNFFVAISHIFLLLQRERVNSWNIWIFLWTFLQIFRAHLFLNVKYVSKNERPSCLKQIVLTLRGRRKRTWKTTWPSLTPPPTRSCRGNVATCWSTITYPSQSQSYPANAKSRNQARNPYSLVFNFRFDPCKDFHPKCVVRIVFQFGTILCFRSGHQGALIRSIKGLAKVAPFTLLF